MLYGFFLFLAVVYNIRKFTRERQNFISSLLDAKSQEHRFMILGHHFHVYIFESFLSLAVAHLISEGSLEINLAGIGSVYLALLGLGFLLYQNFLKYIERITSLSLRRDFNQHLIKEFRVSFALIMLPMLLYSAINWGFEDSMEEWGSFWVLGLLANILFVSVVTILCTVVIMLKLIPNREITEEDYRHLIDQRLKQIGMPGMRVRWIETDIKNAFVVGLKLFRFSNQTMFVGRSLRTSLSLEEFDSIIAHELAHVANRHIQKRVVDLLKNFITGFIGFFVIVISVFSIFSLYHGEEIAIHLNSSITFTILASLTWFIFNYSLMFDTIRSHEFEADAYAVMVLGASFEAYQSALTKLTNQELPEYIKQKKPAKKNLLSSWMSKVFSTHPTLEQRVNFLSYKINTGLPFNYYVSTPQKIRAKIAQLLQWKIALPLTAVLASVITMGVLEVKEGRRLISKIKSATLHEIKGDFVLAKKINSRPLLIGPTLMHEVIARKDPQLIEHFLNVGANKAKTLYYLSQERDYQLFADYYHRFQNELTEDEYYLVLRTTAEHDFTQGYRLMVNSNKFEALNPEYKADVTRLHGKHRAPASIKE